MRFFGKITFSDGTVRKELGGFRVLLTRSVDRDGVLKTVEQSFAVREDGSYALDPGDPVPGDAELSVVSPFEVVLTRKKFSSLVEAGSPNLKPLAVKPVGLGLEIVPAAAAASKPVRVSGRVFVAGGSAEEHAEAAALEVRILGAMREGSPFVPLLSAVTDRTGYFAGTAQKVRLEAAFAETGTGQSIVRHAVRLTADRWLPEPVLLFIAPQVRDESACGCSATPPTTPGSAELAVNGEAFSNDLGAGCQDFTVPNRTLEEFDFFKIVRTTDPTIKGLTIPDTVREELGLPEVPQITFNAGTLANAVGAAALAVELSPKTKEVTLAARRTTEARSVEGAQAMARLAAVTTEAADTPVADYLDVSNLEASGVRRAAEWGGALEEKAMQTAVQQAVSRIPRAALRAALEDPDGFTPEALMTLERRSSARALAAFLDWRIKAFAGRGPLNDTNPVDWDNTPEFYQATSIAHGHILHFKQEWRADGYSLGELVRSIPLAPGQKKQIAILDWDRTDTATRTEATDSAESVQALLSRDRDIDEIANVAFSESLRGGSRATTSSGGGGLGLAIGPLVIGGGGGAAKSSSSAWSDNSRNLAAQTLNQLRDRISQSASSVRNQRSTVVETVGQSERVGATTEVIANYNRCHALTIQYFEVLRHFAVHERIAGVRECLFVPLEMATFDDAKVLRWHDLLLNACRNRRVTPGFEAVRRLNSPEPLPPDRRYADDPVEEIQGKLRIRISIARPKDPTDASVAVQNTEWRLFGWVLRVNPEVVYDRYRRDQAQRDRIFRNEIAPEVAQAFLESLRVMLVDRDGQEHDAGFGITVASRYVENGVMEVELNDTGAGPRLTRAQTAGISIQTEFELPEFSKVVVESASFSYSTERFSGSLFSGTVNDDVVKGDPAFLSTGQLTRSEERNQLAEMRRLRRRLLRHLNDHIEYYHRAIWLGMDANRRFMLLDGFEAPRSGGRSVASVVENRLIGVVGNCLVMPVAAGFQLDPVLAEALAAEDDPQKALERLYQVEPVPPRRLSVPTKGVFAEAMPGKCDSCELIEEDRFWRWKDFPLPDSPSAIGAVSTASRFAEGGNLRPTALPDAIIKFQELPTLPDPTGLSAALNLLGQDVFKDLTGLTNNQKNAMAALTTAMGSSEAFATEAFNLALAKDAARNLDRTLDQIKAAKKADLLTPEQASKATRDALLRSIAATPAPSKDVTADSAVDEAIQKAAQTPGGSAKITREKGEKSEEVAFQVNESALAVGAATARLREYPVEIWVDVPLIRDLVDSNLDYSSADRVTKFETARRSERIPKTLSTGTAVVLDPITSAIESGLMRKTAAGDLQLRVKAIVAYPADPADGNKVLKPAAGSEYAFVAMIHGAAGSVNFGAITDAPAIPLETRPAVKAALSERGDYKGYAYLQKHLAELPAPIVSISFSQSIANLLDHGSEMRSAMLVEAMRQVVLDASQPGSLLGDSVNFRACALMGHSRGGEAVVRAFSALKDAPIPGLEVKAVCSLAPTDWRGASNNDKLALPAGEGVNYLVVYGGLDGDVTGERQVGKNDRGGNGFRLFDRAACDKAMVFIPRATHDRFNTIWAADEAVEWPASQEGITLPGVPVRAHDKPTHLALGREFMGGFFDLILNRNAAEQPRFRGEIASASAVPVALQWNFASATSAVDNFAGAPLLGARTLPATASLTTFAPLKPANARDAHVPHNDDACVVAASVTGKHAIVYDFAGTAPTAFDALRFRLGRLYPFASAAEVADAIKATPAKVDLAKLKTLLTAKQTAIDATPPPNLEVIFEDAAGKTLRITQADIVKNQSNGWVRPEAKVPITIVKNAAGAKTAIAQDATLLFLQTVQVLSSQLSSIDAGQLSKVTFEFTTPAAATEFWLDSIDFVIN